MRQRISGETFRRHCNKLRNPFQKPKTMKMSPGVFVYQRCDFHVISLCVD